LFDRPIDPLLFWNRKYCQFCNAKLDKHSKQHFLLEDRDKDGEGFAHAIRVICKGNEVSIFEGSGKLFLAEVVPKWFSQIFDRWTSRSVGRYRKNEHEFDEVVSFLYKWQVQSSDPKRDYLLSFGE